MIASDSSVVVVNGIEKSVSDKRMYKSFILSNSLQVLVIQDPEAGHAGAAMNVHVGNFSDPEEIPGLAHFLEHMLFLGSEKYPEGNMYSSYLNENGGKSNAYTSMENTNYYFDVNHANLEGAVDRFSQFFICPLFNEDATDGELTVVDSEHSKNLQDDWWRAFQLQKTLSSPHHPFSKFATGNSKTLRDVPRDRGINVRSELFAFHKRYYSSNCMKLVILGRESVEQLESLAVKYFSTIPNYETSPGYDLMTESLPFPESEPPQHVQFVPVKEFRMIELFWQIPDMTKSYVKCPERFVSHFLGHEGDGSILALLKELGWAYEINAGASVDTTSFGLFKIHMDCTAEGMEHVNEIVCIVFRYLDLLAKNNFEAVSESRWQELATELANSFRFQSNRETFNELPIIASHMQKYPVEHCMSHFLLREFDREAIIAMIQMLSPQRLHILSTIQNHSESDLFETERWYGTEYRVNVIPPETVSKWATDGGACYIDRLRLPEPNTFLPDDFTLYEFKRPSPIPDQDAPYLRSVVSLGGTLNDSWKTRLLSNTQRDPTEHWGDKLDISRPPVMIAREPGFTVWYKQDVYFQRPKASLSFFVRLPFAYRCPRSAVILDLYTALASHVLNKVAYAAEIAGLFYTIRSTVYGINVIVGGFSQKLPKLLEHVIVALGDPHAFTQHDFDIIKAKHIRNLRNMEKEQPYQFVSYTANVLMNVPRWHVDDKLEAIKTVSLDSLVQCPVFTGAYVEVFAHGNITASESVDMVSSFCQRLRIDGTSSDSICRVVRLDRGADECLFFKTRDKENPNSAIEVVYQIGPDTPETFALLKVLAQVAREPCFNILRTQQNLGYIVFCGIRLDAGICALRVIIQSSVADPIILNQRVEEFFLSLHTILKQMSAEVLTQNIDALLGTVMEPDTSVFAEAKRWTREIENETYQFARTVKLASCILTVTKNDLLRFFEEHVLNASRRKLSIGVFGRNHSDTLGAESGKLNTLLIRGFKSSKHLYPVQLAWKTKL